MKFNLGTLNANNEYKQIQRAEASDDGISSLKDAVRIANHIDSLFNHKFNVLIISPETESSIKEG